MNDERVTPGGRCYHARTDRSGDVLMVNKRKRPPAAYVLFDGTGRGGGVWMPLSELIPAEDGGS